MLNVIVLQEKKPIKHEITEPQARTLISFGFVATSPPIFAVIGHNTINIPEKTSVHRFPGCTVKL